jgi:hypothetical protein
MEKDQNANPENQNNEVEDVTTEELNNNAQPDTLENNEVEDVTTEELNNNAQPDTLENNDVQLDTS